MCFSKLQAKIKLNKQFLKRKKENQNEQTVYEIGGITTQRKIFSNEF